MRFLTSIALAVCAFAATLPASYAEQQTPLVISHASDNRAVSHELFSELEELARLVDISYCVGMTGIGITRPFTCLSRCSDFPGFELVTTWNTGPLMSDSCGYIALDHTKQRIVVAFRGTYSITNTVMDLSTIPQEYVPYPGSEPDKEEVAMLDMSDDIMHGIHGPVKRSIGTTSGTTGIKCDNCSVHMGFHSSWVITRARILPDLQQQIILNPEYQLTLVGHSLGGAVAALAGLDLEARGFDPIVTTFGEPRVGNKGMVKYIDDQFNLPTQDTEAKHAELRYRRVTHVDDPVPLLPLSEWGYDMHAGEIYISKEALSPDIEDLQVCSGDKDKKCIAGQDSTIRPESEERQMRSSEDNDLLASVQDEIIDVLHEPWGVPSRYKLWQLFFAHRDYFWRLGLCVPGGDPLGGGGKYGDQKGDP